MPELLTIAKVAAETGIAKEVLRKWEVRYGFPAPVREDGSNRLYPADQVKRLVFVRRLIDSGMRPNEVVALDLDELKCLAKQFRGDDAETANAVHHVVEWLRTRDPDLIRTNLRTELENVGLRSFVLNVMPAMNIIVGSGWEKGQLNVRDEHLYTEIVQSLVREAMGTQFRSNARPRILLATPSGEPHGLGLLMVEAALSAEGACCISLGPQVPVPELVAAATDFRADILALSFSVHYGKRKIAPLLREVRASLPQHVELWAGGAGLDDLCPIPRRVSIFRAIPEAAKVLARSRKRLGLGS